jgi:hypothetical protein
MSKVYPVKPTERTVWKLNPKGNPFAQPGEKNRNQPAIVST